MKTPFFLKNSYSISVGIILGFFFIFIIACLTPFGFKYVANTIQKDLRFADSTRDTIINSRSKINQNVANENALINQYNYIEALKKQYLDVATSFEVYYYAFITILVIATVCTTILVAVISQKGWTGQSPNLQATFYGCFFTASLCGVFISVFSYSQNSSNNINKYFYLTNLQTNIYNVLTVNSNFNPLKPSLKRDSDLLNVFSENNKNLKENTNLFLDIKAESIPSTPDITKVLSPKKN